MISIHSPLPVYVPLPSLPLKNNAFGYLVLRPYLLALPLLFCFSAAGNAMVPIKQAQGYLTDESLNS